MLCSSTLLIAEQSVTLNLMLASLTTFCQLDVSTAFHVLRFNSVTASWNKLNSVNYQLTFEKRLTGARNHAVRLMEYRVHSGSWKWKAKLSRKTITTERQTHYSIPNLKKVGESEALIRKCIILRLDLLQSSLHHTLFQMVPSQLCCGLLWIDFGSSHHWLHVPLPP